MVRSGYRGWQGVGVINFVGGLLGFGRGCGGCGRKAVRPYGGRVASVALPVGWVES